MKMVSLGDVYERLDGAKVVVYDEERNCLLYWCGGHGIHVLDGEQGREVAFWNTGDFAQDSITPEEAEASIREHIKEGDYLELY